jgi:hypothetical protein
MAYVVTALWHAKPDKVDRVAAVLDELARTSREDRERIFWRSVGEA